MSILRKTINKFKDIAKHITDKRSQKHQIYTIEDIFMSAFAVFFIQSSSWLSFQRNMQEEKGKDNAKALFGIDKIPTDNHIRDVLDGVNVKELKPFFDYTHTLMIKSNIIDQYKHINNSLLVLLNRTYYHSSSKIHCSCCQTRKDENDNIHYYHSAITPVIAHPNQKSVLSLFPEIITNKDGNEKQDCEINASKRFLNRQDIILNRYPIILLGDDLYSKEPFIKEVKNKKHNFIFVCKRNSHKSIYEYVDMVDNLNTIDTIQITQRNKSNKKITYTYRFLNKIPLTKKQNSIEVNWCDVVVTDENNKKIYSNSFITDLIIDEFNIQKIVEAGRCRWKIENENNNTLKRQGYHLEHNFGHGKKGLSGLLLVLNILSFLLHTFILLANSEYKNVYNLIGKRKEFFNHIKTLTTFFYYESWEDLFTMMKEGYKERIDARKFVDMQQQKLQTL
jgi:hypothetical protein